jgi:hypothetical protein
MIDPSYATKTSITEALRATQNSTSDRCTQSKIACRILLIFRLIKLSQQSMVFHAGEHAPDVAGFEARMEACDHPWKLVPLSPIAFQLRRMLAGVIPRAPHGVKIGIPINVFDAISPS